MKRPLLSLALLTLLDLANAAHGEILGARALPPTATLVISPSRRPAAPPPWPKPPPPPRVVTVPRLDDDRPGAWLQAQFAARRINFEADPLTDWRRVIPPSRYSLEWTGRWAPDVRLGATQLPAAQLADLSDSAWRTYVSTLQRTYFPRATINLDDDTNKNADMTRILGARTRVIRFDIPPDDPAGKPTQLLIVAAEFPGGVLAFTCDGPARDVAALAPTFERLLNRAESLEP